MNQLKQESIKNEIISDFDPRLITENKTKSTDSVIKQLKDLIKTEQLPYVQKYFFSLVIAQVGDNDQFWNSFFASEAPALLREQYERSQFYPSVVRSLHNISKKWDYHEIVVHPNLKSFICELDIIYYNQHFGNKGIIIKIMNSLRSVNKKVRVALLASSALAIIFLFLLLSKSGRSGNSTKKIIEQDSIINQLKEANLRLRDSARPKEQSFIKINKDTVIEVRGASKDTIRFRRIK